MDKIKLINEIYCTDGDTLLEKIVSYCEKNNFDIQEFGDLLSESEIFKKHLWIDCVRHNIIKDEPLQDKLNETEDFEEW